MSDKAGPAGLRPTVIAMGGNSLLDATAAPTVQNQFSVAARAVGPIAELMHRGVRAVLTHGNGPQVGFMQLRVELAKGELHEVPLDSLVADTQGALGYMIERTLRETLRCRRSPAEIVTLVTEVETDRDDPAFDTPTKPVGRFYSEAEARCLMAQRGWRMVEDAGRGYRRVVASPLPRAIVQLPAIRRLVEAGVTVIACGGGGIPVTRDQEGHIQGVEAVIDKDRVSALLALGLGAARLVITTGVDAVYRDYLGARKQPIGHASVGELTALAAAGAFPPGSMGPKIEAAIDFLSHGGEEVVICRPEALVEALEGAAGTHLYKEPA